MQPGRSCAAICRDATRRRHEWTMRMSQNNAISLPGRRALPRPPSRFFFLVVVKHKRTAFSSSSIVV